ncbi:glycosyltransferase [Flavobacterium sp. GSA192]|uniref:glycosyltransferase n=1 Tax=Flavobacterium sp. GSA192 TaxID=2576304 RepID=UPI00112B4715|nr:glycosyltransferase [Flavobacterium sp. GSA192]
MKKKILFVIPSLAAGGAEKSLVNLLHQIDFDKYEVDLFLFKKAGLFLNSVPTEVTILEPPTLFEKFNSNLVHSILYFLSRGNLKLLFSRIQFFVTNRLNSNSAIAEQKSWKYYQHSIKGLEKKYDAAIGFLEKSAIYFIVDKVVSKKKIGFIHNDYNQLGLDKKFDKPFFNQLDSIVTVSEQCANVLNQEFPEFKRKVEVVFNINSAKLIKQLAFQDNAIEINSDVINIVSVGRLDYQKGFDMAIDAFCIIKSKGYDIKWYVIGEGNERFALENNIHKLGLSNSFFLLGLRENPYSYLRLCDLYVQPSRYEGKSIAVDEAKILEKPIVVTNFTTAKDQINSGVNGLITDMNPEAIADAIVSIIKNKEMAASFTANLSDEKLGTEEEINKLYQLIHS